MNIARKLSLSIGLAAATGILVFQTSTGTCLLCSFASTEQSGLSGIALASAQPEPKTVQDEFQLVRRPGSVDIKAEYDMSGLKVPADEIHALLPRDAIPALTDPIRQALSDANWLSSESRIIVVRVGDEVLGVPLAILNWHEIVNTTVGGQPIAATYCPLCDSATVFNRTLWLPSIDGKEPEMVVLEFGVSGALFNSNVLMYDTRDKGLWSQLGMHAISGPMAGTALDMLPVEIVSFAKFRNAHKEAEIVSNETGHERNYGASPYSAYFANNGLVVPVRGVGDALPRKTLGLGVATDHQAWFVPAALSSDGYTLSTPDGDVTLDSDGASVRVLSAPEGIRTVQTFYYSWSAFYPDTIVVTD